MYEELINLLRRCGEQKCKNCEYEHVLGCVTKMNERAADAIEVLSKKEKTTRWIPVTERLPDESEPVLACVYWPDYTDNEICYGQYIKNGRFRLTHYVEGELIKGYEVKAWMPFPEPPEEET